MLEVKIQIWKKKEFNIPRQKFRSLFFYSKWCYLPGYICDYFTLLNSYIKLALDLQVQIMDWWALGILMSLQELICRISNYCHNFIQ